MKRSEIYEVINGERRYQGQKWGADDSQVLPHPCGTTVLTEDGFVENWLSVGDWLTIIRHHVARADAAYATSHGNSEALAELRKVVALGVACFEQHGCPERAAQS